MNFSAIEKFFVIQDGDLFGVASRTKRGEGIVYDSLFPERVASAIAEYLNRNGFVDYETLCTRVLELSNYLDQREGRER